MVCMWNRFLKPWSLEIASRWHWRQLWSTAYTFHPPQARLQRGSTLLKLGRLEQAAADFSELVCTCFYSSICIPQKQMISESGKAWIIHHKGTHIWICTPKLESKPVKSVVLTQQKSEALTMVEHLNGWSMVCLLYAVAPPPYVCPRAHKNGWLE